MDARSDHTIAATRLRLRPLALEDAPRLSSLADDLDVARQTAALPHPYALGDAQAFITAQADPPRGMVNFAVELAGEGLIGVMGFRPEPGSPWPEFGYWLGRPYWGAGLATEAAAAALAWAHAGWGRRAVTAGHFTDNPASGRVLEKAGFLYTGVRRSYRSLARTEPSESREMVWLA